MSMTCMIVLQSCTKVALDFVSPENVGECFLLTEEIRKLPVNPYSTDGNIIGLFPNELEFTKSVINKCLQS